MQIAKILGANVTAVCSHRNVELVNELGADRVIDYTKTDLVDLEERFDAIFDVFGNYCFDQLKHLLTPRGTYVHTIPSSRIFKDVART
ncbi:MAG: zinc-binding dehydrogenase, partial [Deltaproteobacteria bacterium]|nr:zinc-binding dehydrogenase [Deltaproteobacteria bacterium]